MVDQNAIPVKKICDIIKACAEHGVSKLTLGNLSLEFGSPTVAQTHSPTPQPENLPQIGVTDPEAQPDILNPYAQELTDYELATLDPAEWERRQLEVTDAPTA